LRSLCHLAEKSYYFAGSNSGEKNAYFVKKGKEKGLKIHSYKSGFVSSKFRESRNQNGQLNLKSGQERLKLLKEISIYNAETKGWKSFNFC
jgi:hypothetical protein